MTLLGLALALTLQVQDADYFPIKTGSEWSYSLSNGATMTLRVTGTARVKDVECTVFESALGTNVSKEFIAVTAEGVKAYKVEGASGAGIEYPTPILRTKLPFKEGETWTVVVPEAFMQQTYVYKTEGIETIKVPAGSFECRKYTAKCATVKGAVTISMWVARGIGAVKQTYEMPGQSVSAELTRTNVKGAGPAGSPDFVRFESKDGKALAYHPRGWKVLEGPETFGPGTYLLSIEEADQTSAVLFMTFAASEQLVDSVALSNFILGNLKRAYPDLEVSGMSSSRDRARTSAAAAYTFEGKPMTAHIYLFHTKRAGTLYALVARKEKFDAARPTLTAIIANLAYAPEGVAKILQQGRETAQAAPRPQGQNLSPAWMIRDAHQRLAQGEGKDVPFQQAVAQDNSFSMAIPRGWTFQAAKLAWSTTSDPQNLRGASALSNTIFVPGGYGVQTPGMLVSPYLPPDRALAYLMQVTRLGANLRVLSATTLLEIDPDYANKAWKPALAAGAQLDNRVMHVEFSHSSGAACRGVFSVTSTAWPLGTSWTCQTEGSWGPSEEYDKLTPVFARIFQSPQQNQAWLQGQNQAQAAESARLTGNLTKSIGELNKSYERYNQSWWDSQRSRDYTSHMYSQTTLGQGTWVSQVEGAQVIRSDSWGIENTQRGERTSAWNNTTFTGRNPWSGEQLDLVDTRAEYEKYIRGR